MTVVEIDERFRLALSKEVRRSFKVKRGQKLYVIPAGDTLIIKKIPANIPKQLRKIIGSFAFDRSARKKAEKWFLKQTK